MQRELAAELGTQETCTLEFKRVVKDLNVIRKAVCAMANDLTCKGSGDIVIGVREDGTVEPALDTSDKALLNLANLRDDGKILDRPSFTVERARFNGEPVIHIHVEASPAPPVRLDGVAWVRPGPTTRRATADDERVLAERRRCKSLPFDSHPWPGSTTADLDLRLFRNTYLPNAVSEEVLEENHRPEEQQLASLRLLDPDSGQATVLGLLLIGLDPSASLPGAYTQFVRYEGDHMDSVVVDDQELRANVVGTAQQLNALLRGHIHTRLMEVGGFREETRPDYPLAALREAIMNAIMHRNYESSNAPIRILWFADRVEISNPGGPYGAVRQDNYDRMNDYRNPSLAGALKNLGYVNRFGRGISRIREALARNGNPPPEFEVEDSHWAVVLRRG
ncbi:ATP-binding protein [Nocardiopsis algeriensis]|uniref:ATP-dependent DNA helicase RecG n=1 Tax=Nocardiopsis algeriensis TaxID=1478215 RepID=A0A841IRC3_9ACTN|nr:ATP-binding protein [Nocardiopsis algeriensis]MBB6121237.1 ATP-dependent DNA helicase RecG [Nocardiopsis algeriensis]